jgi:hypothetical protein
VPKKRTQRRAKGAEKCAKSTPKSSNKAKERPQKAKFWQDAEKPLLRLSFRAKRGISLWK